MEENDNRMHAIIHIFFVLLRSAVDSLVHNIHHLYAFGI